MHIKGKRGRKEDRRKNKEKETKERSRKGAFQGKERNEKWQK